MKKDSPKPGKNDYLFEGNEQALKRSEKLQNDIFNFAITIVLSLVIFFTLSTVPGIGSIFFLIGFIGFVCSTICCVKAIIQYRLLMKKLKEEYLLKKAKEAQQAQKTDLD